MLTLHGSRRRLCDGVTRRELLQLGGLGMLGLTLADALRRPVRPTPSARFGARRRRCILLFPYGSPPQHETFDPKPDAPAEVRGELGSIATAVPGLRICERLPRIARVMDRVTVVRSVTHPYPVHGVAYAVTGMPTYSPALETQPRDPQHWPFIGSVVDYLEEQRAGGRVPAVPRNVALPWMLNSKTDVLVNAGPFAAFLGQAYDPVWTDFDGAGTRIAPEYSQGQKRRFHDPFAATTPAGRFSFARAEPAPMCPSNGSALRRSLLDQFEAARRGVDRAGEAGAVDRQRALAFRLLTSPACGRRWTSARSRCRCASVTA